MDLPNKRAPSLNTANRYSVSSINRHASTMHSTRSVRTRSRLSTLLKHEARDQIIKDVSKAGQATVDVVEKKSKQTVMLGLFLMLLSGVLYSLLAALVVWANDLGYSPSEILMYRASVQMIVAATQYLIAQQRLKKANISAADIRNAAKQTISKKQIAAILGRGMFGAGSTFTYFTGATMIDVGDCVTLKGLAATFTAFAGFIILKDPITVKHGLALIFAMIACILIAQPPLVFDHIPGFNKHGSNEDFMKEVPGYLVSTSSSMFQAGVYICIKLAGKVPAVMLIFSQGTFSCLLGVGVLIFIEKEFHGFGTEWKEYVCIICLCGIGYVSQYTLTRGGQLLIAGLASLMRATDIAWSFVWGILFFGQTPNYLTIIGAAIMFGSVFSVSLEKIKKAAQKNEQQASSGVHRKTTVHTTDVWTVEVEDDDDVMDVQKDSFQAPLMGQSPVLGGIKQQDVMTVNQNKYGQNEPMILQEEHELSVSEDDEDDAPDIGGKQFGDKR